MFLTFVAKQSLRTLRTLSAAANPPRVSSSLRILLQYLLLRPPSGPSTSVPDKHYSDSFYLYPSAQPFDYKCNNEVIIQFKRALCNPHRSDAGGRVRVKGCRMCMCEKRVYFSIFLLETSDRKWFSGIIIYVYCLYVQVAKKKKTKNKSNLKNRKRNYMSCIIARYFSLPTDKRSNISILMYTCTTTILATLSKFDTLFFIRRKEFFPSLLFYSLPFSYFFFGFFNYLSSYRITYLHHIVYQ